MTLAKAIEQTDDLDTIPDDVIEAWAKTYSIPPEKVRVAIERERRKRKRKAARANAVRTMVPPPVAPITLDSIRDGRAKRAAKAQGTSPAPRTPKGPSGS